ncbi:arginine--tRNA ligase [Patescibacteria group bacterium]
MYEEEIKKAVIIASGIEDVHLETPEIDSHGDYATNVAMVLAKKEKKNPKEVAEEIKGKLAKGNNLSKYVSKIEIAGPGFINFWLNNESLISNLEKVIKEEDKYGSSHLLKGKKIMVEYAHPNTHKEMHIGHMRTLTVGESLGRIFEFMGAKVFRANYQGDIGPHVAKSIWGTKKILEEKKTSWEEADAKFTLKEKAHLLGEGYVLGVDEYKDKGSEIDELNISLYAKDKKEMPTYELSRKWSLDYYNVFYTRFGTKFDRLFFESEIADKGKETVIDNIGEVFTKSEGAVIFDGEKYGLHKRVFITKDGNATYEAKEMGLIPLQYKTFEFDRNVHVVANEQTGYFKVVFKAMEVLNSKFKEKLFHLPMGMVNLVGKKMSSRTGEIFTVDDLLDEVKSYLTPLIDKEIKTKEKDDIAEVTTIGAIKYSVLKVNPKSDVIFDVKKSVSLHGNSGPYLQYTYARCQSVLKKAKNTKKDKINELNKEELKLLRSFAQFQGIMVNATNNYSPNTICNFLNDLAQKYNSFYNKHKIIGEKNQYQRIEITKATGQILENGLNLLGINAPKRM